MSNNPMSQLIRRQNMQNHYSAVVNIKSTIGSYINTKPPMHIKKKTKINRQRTYQKMSLQQEYLPRPRSAYARQAGTDARNNRLRSKPRLPSGKTTYHYRDPPELTAQEKAIQDMINGPEYAEQREAYKRIACLKKGGTDLSRPATFEKSAQLSINKKLKASVHTQAEHARELKSLKDRIQQQGSWAMRRKNPQDPLANPVWFFKGKNRDADLEKRLDLTGYEQAVKAKYRQEQDLYRKIDEAAGYTVPSKVSPAKAVAKPILKTQNQDLQDGGSLKKPKRVSYQNTWKTRTLNYDPKTNSNKDDMQKLSDKIRPKETIFKERPVPDFTRSVDQDEIEEDF